MIQMIVCDMDGTLLTKDGKIAQKTKEALLCAQEKGIVLVLASGRPIHRMLSYALELKMDQYHGHLVYVNGIGHYDMESKKNELKYPLQLVQQKELFQYFSKKNIEFLLMNDRGGYSYIPRTILLEKLQYLEEHQITGIYDLARSNESYLGDYYAKGYTNIKYIINEESLDVDMNKMALVGDHDELLSILKEARLHFKDRYWMGMTMDHWCEIMHPEATKLSAIQKLADDLGILFEDIAAFGDGENDVSLLQHVGYGFAMGNALELVKQQVDDHTDGHEEDGIAKALERLGI